MFVPVKSMKKVEELLSVNFGFFLMANISYVNGLYCNIQEAKDQYK